MKQALFNLIVQQMRDLLNARSQDESNYSFEQNANIIKMFKNSILVASLDISNFTEKDIKNKQSAKWVAYKTNLLNSVLNPPVLINSLSSYTGDITLATQLDIDNFSVNYPGVDTITGNLLIEPTFYGGITNLNGITALTNISGNLSIIYTFVENLDGLSNLVFVGGMLDISANTSLQNIDSLSNLTQIGGNLRIASCNALLNLNGLSNLTQVGGSLSVKFNQNLYGFCGLLKLLDATGSWVGVGTTIQINNNLFNPTGLEIYTACNSQPVANAGQNQSVICGQLVQLDGSNSSDPNNHALTYSWTLYKPVDSNAVLSDINIINPTFVADKIGSYAAGLVVNDSYVNSNTSYVFINATNNLPIVYNSSLSPSVAKINSPINLTCSATDVDYPYNQVVSAKYAINSGPFVNFPSFTPTASTVNLSTSLVAPSSAGFYDISVVSTDSCGAESTPQVSKLVVYNPIGQVSGSGKFKQLSYTTLAEFIFNIKYTNNLPTGTVNIKYNNKTKTFISTDNIEYFVIDPVSNLAQIKTYGKVNNTGNYSCILETLDAKKDQIRVKIVDEILQTVVFDNLVLTNISSGSITLKRI